MGETITLSLQVLISIDLEQLPFLIQPNLFRFSNNRKLPDYTQADGLSPSLNDISSLNLFPLCSFQQFCKNLFYQSELKQNQKCQSFVYTYSPQKLKLSYIAKRTLAESSGKILLCFTQSSSCLTSNAFPRWQDGFPIRPEDCQRARMQWGLGRDSRGMWLRRALYGREQLFVSSRSWG